MKETERKENSPANPTEKLAEENGVAIVLADEHSSVFKANNNSICEALYSSEEFAPRCDEFCGRAFQMATEAGKPVGYQCHAGLDCLAVPLETEKPLVAIVGRAFTKAENYRKATERAISGDWSKFPPTQIFENVLLSGSTVNLETVAKRLEKSEPSAVADGLTQPTQNENSNVSTANLQPPATAGGSDTDAKSDADEIAKLAEPFSQQTAQTVGDDEKIIKRTSAQAGEITAWRSLFGALFNLSYKKARLSILQFVSKRYSLASLAWLERKNNHFESILASGTLRGQQFKINLAANDELLRQAAQNQTPLELRERAQKGETKKRQTISLFPISVGGEVQSALVVADKIPDETLKRHISRFCQTVASQLEILRLREEVKRRNWLSNAVEKFNASLKSIDTEDFWSNLTRISAELMRSERSSILLFDEKADAFTVKAAIGATADRIRNKTEEIGERIARVVLHNGNPVVVEDIRKIGLPAAPSDWKYKTNSFISYPFVIGERKIGVLNVADKADGAAYSEFDLELLEAIAPQVAVLIDRATLKNKAGEFEQLSVTDGLTGLPNRRYLEERLSEEIKRSNRYGYPTSFMMIDVDEFKPYNDKFGHPEGDKALRVVGQSLRETLRGADVAARYGGEEFSILLPQTTLGEAETIAERIRENIEAAEFPNRQITVSIGIAGCCVKINSPQELIVAADKALYEAKRKGRNNVQVYEKLKENAAEKKS